jgi:phosphatidylserine decarboxylase
MRIPLTKYGWPQVVVVPAVVLLAMVIIGLGTETFLPLWAMIIVEGLLAGVFILSLSFFRDPARQCPSDTNLLLAPADGLITDVEIIDGNDRMKDTTLRIGIFLSIFNTHINRAPCHVKVEGITYKKGKYKNALNPESARVNESNEVLLTRTDHPRDRLVVRQISGAIARRIVCDTKAGQELAAGEKFGMIKFGSRTELYVRSQDSQYQIQCLVHKGDKVKAGLTPLVRYETCQK